MLWRVGRASRIQLVSYSFQRSRVHWLGFQKRIRQRKRFPCRLARSRILARVLRFHRHSIVLQRRTDKQIQTRCDPVRCRLDEVAGSIHSGLMMYVPRSIEGVSSSESIVVSSAILPSPDRICKNADNRSYVNPINLHTQAIPLYPGGKQAQFRGGCRRGHSLSLAPLWGALIGHHSGLGGSA